MIEESLDSISNVIGELVSPVRDLVKEVRYMANELREIKQSLTNKGEEPVRFTASKAKTRTAKDICKTK